MSSWPTLCASLMPSNMDPAHDTLGLGGGVTTGVCVDAASVGLEVVGQG